MNNIFSLSGGKIDKRNNHLINEDLLIQGKNYTILMDGATGLGNKELDEYLTSGEWYTKNLALYLNRILEKSTFKDINDIKQIVNNGLAYMRVLIKERQKTLNVTLEKYEIPSSSLLIIYETMDKILLFSLGDCVVYIKYDDENIEIIRNTSINNLDNEVFKKMKEISLKNNISIKEAKNDSIVDTMLKNNRSKMNSKDGYYIASDDVEATNYAILKEFYKKEIKKIFISTDGFYFDALNIDINEFMKKVTNDNICTCINKIKAELLSDKNWSKYSNRFKDLDDITAIVAYKR